MKMVREGGSREKVAIAAGQFEYDLQWNVDASGAQMRVLNFKEFILFALHCFLLEYRRFMCYVYPVDPNLFFIKRQIRF